MIFKQNNGQKRTLNIRKKGTKHSKEVCPHPTYPLRYATGLNCDKYCQVEFDEKSKIKLETIYKFCNGDLNKFVLLL